MLDVTVHVTIYTHIHLVYMETRDHVVCKDKTLADTDSTFNFKLPCDTW